MLSLSLPVTDIKASLDEMGFCVIPAILSPEEIENLIGGLPDLSGRAGTRSLLDFEVGQACINHRSVRELANSALGPSAKPVRGILFDKTPEANWNLGWHQDTKIAVRERIDVPGYSAWSVKENVVHCQPPLHILENSVAIRIHLDDCDETNGPLLVIPSSNRNGLNDVADEASAIKLTCKAGDAILMKPLVLHASRKSESPRHRRVIHIEYCSVPLHGGLRWATDSNP
jgi:Phytanoyl-CoA dioxygenase (PhyH)